MPAPLAAHEEVQEAERDGDDAHHGGGRCDDGDDTSVHTVDLLLGDAVRVAVDHAMVASTDSGEQKRTGIRQAPGSKHPSEKLLSPKIFSASRYAVIANPA